jgi:hypothetical protein
LEQTQDAQVPERILLITQGNELTKRILTIITFAFVFTILSGILINIQINTNAGESPSVANVFWRKTYGGTADDRAFNAISTDTGYIVVGSTRSYIENSTIGFALWTDFNGNAIFNKTYIEGLGTELRHVVNISEGFLIVGNTYLDNGDIDGFILRINKIGDIIWRKTIGSNGVDKIFSAVPSEYGDTFIAMGTTTLSDDHLGAWFVKLRIDGQVIWEKSYQAGIDSSFRAGVKAPDGNYIVCGYSKILSENYDLLVAKIGQDGKLLWTRTHNQVGSQKAYSIVKTTDGCLIAGDSQSAESDSDAMIVRIDWDGNILWTKNVGGKAADSASAISISSDNHFLVTGFTFSFGAGNRDLWLFKISNTGDVLWSCVQGDEAYQEAYQVIEVKRHQFVVFGWTDPLGQPELIGNAQYDIYIVKLSPKI